MTPQINRVGKQVLQGTPQGRLGGSINSSLRNDDKQSKHGDQLHGFHRNTKSETFLLTKKKLPLTIRRTIRKHMSTLIFQLTRMCHVLRNRQKKKQRASQHPKQTLLLIKASQKYHPNIIFRITECGTCRLRRISSLFYDQWGMRATNSYRQVCLLEPSPPLYLEQSQQENRFQTLPSELPQAEDAPHPGS